MDKIRLGRTGLMVSRSGFGAIPIQRISNIDAAHLLRKAYDNGINFFDTARNYTDSEEKIGYGLKGIRDKIIIATKSTATDPKIILEDLHTSLNNLKTDYVDIFQFHNPTTLHDIAKREGVCEVIGRVRKEGKVRFVGLTNHRLAVVQDALGIGLFDTIQYPLNHLSSENEVLFVKECSNSNVGFIGMKALSGGLITNAAISYAFLRQFGNVVPVWGIQHEWELDNILSFEINPPVLDEAMKALIEKDRLELSGSFCRGCGYCLPCPANIPIPTAARISLLLGRTVYTKFLEDEFRQEMLRIKNCINCGHCKDHCPYELDTPALLQTMLKKYEQFYAEKNKFQITQ